MLIPLIPCLIGFLVGLSFAIIFVKNGRLIFDVVTAMLAVVLIVMVAFWFITGEFLAALYGLLMLFVAMRIGFVIAGFAVGALVGFIIARIAVRSPRRDQ